MANNPTYTDLEEKLQQANDILDALHNHKVDAVIGTDDIAMMRLKEVEDQLHEQIKISSNRLKEIESIYENVPVGLCVLDTDLKFIRVNNHLAEMNGIPAKEHIGYTIGELLPDISDDIEKQLQEVLQTGESKMDVEVSATTPADPDTKHYWLHHWLPLYSKEGDELIGVNMVIQEITARKKYEKKLHDLNTTLEERVEMRTKSLLAYQKQLRSLASKLSKSEEQERQRLASHLHDNLGQMLAIGKMRMETLKKDGLPEDVTSDLADIHELINNALTYSRELMSELKPPPTIDEEDIRVSIKWLADKMEKHNLNVVLDDDGRPKPAAKEIRNILLQSVRELLFNIVKHTDVNEARIEMQSQDDQLQIIVSDEGKGFDPEKDMTVSTDNGGFGLFNISERLDLLGCSIDVDSQPGDGTRITITAPLKETVASDAAEDKSTEPPEPEKAVAEHKEKISVLLADDHEMVREGLKRMVDAEEDLRVVAEASDGAEAVDMARQVKPDVVVMDVNMPHMDGITATIKIKSEIPNVRIVGLSLHDNEEVINSMRDAGALAYITKKEAVESLCATIRSEAKRSKVS